MLTVQRSNTGKHVARRRTVGRSSSRSVGPLGSSPTWAVTDSNTNWLYPPVTIGKLPDDVLLETFAVYVAAGGPRYCEDRWRTLVHVCKRWRSVVFASPRRLDLQLYCTNTRPVKKLLDIWPPLPIHIFATTRCAVKSRQVVPRGVTNLLAALKQRNRVCGITIFGVPNSILKMSLVMKPFPALAELSLSSDLPDSFLGGSAPRLRLFSLTDIPFPGIGKLLLSTTDLVSLTRIHFP